MATGLPRYQTMGVQYADLPQVSTAPQRAAVAGLSSIERALDQMSAYFGNQAITEAEKAGARYAAENPVTKEQVDAALGDPQALKVKGAGRIFQQTYQSTQAVLLSNELLTEGKKEIAKMSAAIEAGGPVNLQDIETTLKDMADGYASTIMALDPAQSVKLRASLATIGSALYTKAGDKVVERMKADKIVSLDDALKTDRVTVRDLLRQGLPAQDLQKRLEILKQGYRNLSLFPKDEYVDQFYKMADEEKVAFLIERGTDISAGDEVDAVEKAQKGDFGNASGVFASLDSASKEKVLAGINTRFQSLSAARARVLTNQRNEANTILSGIYGMNDIASINGEIAKIKELAVAPEVLANARAYRDALLQGGPKTDDLLTYTDLSRKASAFSLTSAEVIQARKNRKITDATAKALLKDINDPSDVVAESTRVFRRLAMITNENLPPEIESPTSRQAASLAFAKADAELRRFASTRNIDTQQFPTEQEVKAKSIELGKDIGRAMLPVYEDEVKKYIDRVNNKISAYKGQVKLNDFIKDSNLQAQVFAVMAEKNVSVGEIKDIERYLQDIDKYNKLIEELKGR